MQPYKSVCIVAVILFETEVIVGVVIPMFWNVKGINSIGLQCANCFAGGILFACGQLSILAPATQYLIDDGIYYPITYLIALATFVIIFTADKLFGGDLVAQDDANNLQPGSQIQLTQEQLDELQIQRSKTGDVQKGTQDEIQKKDFFQNIEVNQQPEKKPKFPITTIILMFALFLDTFLEGLALGLQKNMDGIIQLMIGFLTHQ